MLIYTGLVLSKLMSEGQAFDGTDLMDVQNLIKELVIQHKTACFWDYIGLDVT